MVSHRDHRRRSSGGVHPCSVRGQGGA
jgi:hypothetical protein